MPTSKGRALACALTALTASACTHALPPLERVDTRRGTHTDPGEEGVSRGSTFPAAALPYGFNMWTPVTEPETDRWIYLWQSPSLQGFAVSHQPSPWMADYGMMQVWPMQGPLKTDPKERAITFAHSREVARPFEYYVERDDGLRARIVPTDHAAVMVFTPSQSGDLHILFDTVATGSGALDIDATRGTVSGSVLHRGQRLYVYATLHGAKVTASGRDAGRPLGTWLKVDAQAGREVSVSIGTSFISVESAQRNLATEVGDQSWRAVRAAGVEAWQRIFAQIDVSDGPPGTREVFYANLYRTHLYPNSRWEVDESGPLHHSPYDGKVHRGKLWVNNGFWDTYRTTWPLHMLLAPSRTGEMLDGFVSAFKEGGWTPRWSAPGFSDGMVGTHTDIIFADAYLKGIRNFDVPAAYASSIKNAMVCVDTKDRGRQGICQSNFTGYVASDSMDQSAAWHLENSVNDFGTARLAEALGHTAEAAYLFHRSLNYRNLFDADVGFFRGRKRDGHWRVDAARFSPQEWGWEFTEGDAWHYAFPAPFDAVGMAQLYGGWGGMETKLDAMLRAPPDFSPGDSPVVMHEMREAYVLNLGQYSHSNETVHHVPCMYHFAGRPDKASDLVRRVIEPPSACYDTAKNTGDGYCGDEDNGQMSAWYVMSALGLYPVSPGFPEYAIVAPLFKRATVHLENGQDFVIDAPASSHANRYIQRAWLNGHLYEKNTLDHADVVAGGRLELELGPQPSPWGTASAARPTSLDNQRYAAPLRDLTKDTLTPIDAAAADDDATTTWHSSAASPNLVFCGQPASSSTVQLYTVTSSSQPSDQDPSRWTLEGSNDAVHWTQVDERHDEQFQRRQETRVFTVIEAKSWRCYRFVFTRAEHNLSLAEVELLTHAE